MYLTSLPGSMFVSAEDAGVLRLLVQPACLHSVQCPCQEMCRLFVVVREANSVLSRTTKAHCDHPVHFMLLLWYCLPTLFQCSHQNLQAEGHKYSHDHTHHLERSDC